MFFEGAEKKLEIVTSEVDLRGLGEKFWAILVKECNAEILSSISSKELDSYLLSESSLFVWDDRFLILTCGNTSLVNSALFFLKEFGPKVSSLIFQRKNEYDSRFQKSSFGEDVSRISNVLPGKAYRFGNLDSHHMHLFHSSGAFSCSEDDKTFELLMYHIDESVRKSLQETRSLSRVRDILGLHELLPKFSFDDHLFDPYGYSLNGISGPEYLTVHISPESGSSYISFESNLELEDHAAVYRHLLNIVKPASFDTIGFNQSSELLTLKDKRIITTANELLDNGYDVDFTHYVSSDVLTVPVIELELGGFHE